VTINQTYAEILSSSPSFGVWSDWAFWRHASYWRSACSYGGL